MRIVPFPADDPLPGQEAWTAELEAALRGESRHPDARAWRELRDDVRVLAPAMAPAFEVRLAQELEHIEGIGVAKDRRPANRKGCFLHRESIRFRAMGHKSALFSVSQAFLTLT